MNMNRKAKDEQKRVFSNISDSISKSFSYNFYSITTYT